MKRSTSSSRSSCSNTESHKVNHRKTYTISAIGQKPVLDYEGSEVRCYCGKKALLWASWTDVNPGRRFVTCAFFNRCNFHSWVDEEMQDRPKDVIIGLRNREKEFLVAMDMLVDESEELRQREATLDVMVKMLTNDATNLKEQNDRLRRKLWFMVFCLTICMFMYFSI